MAEASLEAKVIRGAESWQFFAFVFGALTAISFAFVDDIAERRWGRLAIRLLVCAGIAYPTLLNPKSRNGLVRLLNRWKVEG